VAESVIRLSVINDASPKLRVVDRDAKKLSNTVKNSNGVLNNQSKSLKGAALGWLGVGKGAKAATPAIAGAGVAMNTALSFLLPLVAAGTALSKVFGTLVEQDFAEAKFETLGGNSDALVGKLKELTHELRGQASVTELTAAAYDIASAGFTDAAEAAEILKAASLGATGGFTDINTSGGAAVKVLNAYGKTADEAAFLMDQFAQTQADGIITIGQYSDNIGKVATTAAGLKVPLAEINAVIAQSTAAGTQTETAFTGLNAALAKISSGQVGKKLGVDINDVTLASEGLSGTLEKLSQFSTAELQQAFGIEAFKGLQVAIKDTEKFNKLLENQVNAQGAASKAAFTASDTLQGQIKRLGVSFQNIFAEGSELGEILKQTIRALAMSVDVFGAKVKLLALPFRVIFKVIQGIAEAIGEAFGIEQINIIQDLEKAWANAFIDLERRMAKAMAEGKLFGRNLVIAVKNVGVAFERVMKIANERIKIFAQNFVIRIKIAEERVKLFAQNFVSRIKNVWIDIQNSMPDWVKRMFGISKEPLARIKIEEFDENKLDLPELQQFDKSKLDLPEFIKFETLDASQFEPEAWKKKIEAEKAANAAAELALKKQIELTKQLKEAFEKVGKTIKENLVQGVKGLIKGTQTLGETLTNIAHKVSDMLIDMALSSAFENFKIPGLSKSAKGNVYAQNGIVPFAKGGIVDSPTIFPFSKGIGLMGEKGPESVMPLRRGKGGRLGVEASGSGSISVVVNVDASGSAVEGDDNQAKELGNMIAGVVQAELVRQKRPGGLLTS